MSGNRLNSQKVIAANTAVFDRHKAVAERENALIIRVWRHLCVCVRAAAVSSAKWRNGNDAFFLNAVRMAIIKWQ
jgi:hypothetical protein